MERNVVEVVTPGTAVTDSLLAETSNNYVAAAFRFRDQVGFAAADVSTGEFLVEDLPLERFEEAVSQLSITEWVVPDDLDLVAPLPPANGNITRPGWWFDPDRGRRQLAKHFGTQSLRGFDCDDLAAAPGAASAVLDYLHEVRGCYKDIRRFIVPWARCRMCQPLCERSRA